MNLESRTAEIRIARIADDPNQPSETDRKPATALDTPGEGSGHAPLCAAHFEERYGEEPDMSDGDWLTFQRGTCSQCGKNAITFRVTA